MIRSGEVDTRKSSGIPLGVGAAFARMMPDKYYCLLYTSDAADE